MPTAKLWPIGLWVLVFSSGCDASMKAAVVAIPRPRRHYGAHHNAPRTTDSICDSAAAILNATRANPAELFATIHLATISNPFPSGCQLWAVFVREKGFVKRRSR